MADQKSVESGILEALDQELRSCVKRDKVTVQLIHDFWRVSGSVNEKIYELNTHIDIMCRNRYEEDQVATSQYEMFKQYIAIVGRCISTSKHEIRDIMDDRRRLIKDNNDDAIINMNADKALLSTYNEFIMVAGNNVKTMLALVNNQKYKDHLFNKADVRGSMMHD